MEVSRSVRKTRHSTRNHVDFFLRYTELNAFPFPSACFPCFSLNRSCHSFSLMEPNRVHSLVQPYSQTRWVTMRFYMTPRSCFPPPLPCPAARCFYLYNYKNVEVIRSVHDLSLFNLKVDCNVEIDRKY